MMVKRKKIRKTVIALVVILLGLIGIAAAISYAVYDRSLQATIVENRLNNMFDTVSLDDLKAMVEKMETASQKRVKVNPKDFESKVQDTDYKDIQVITFGDKDKAKHRIMYVHGGGWMANIAPHHLELCDKLANELSAYVVAPIYKLAPKYTFKDSFPVMVDLYKDLSNKGKNKVSIMGDSAGGQLTLALTMDIKEKKLPLPYRVVTISPATDVSMTASTAEEYAEYEAADPVLSVDIVRYLAGLYFVNMDDHDYHKSPYYYKNWKGFPKTLVFIGTHDVLYPDAVKLVKKMQDGGVDAKLIVGKNLDHVYLLLDKLPEAKQAFKYLKEEFK